MKFSTIIKIRLRRIALVVLLACVLCLGMGLYGSFALAVDVCGDKVYININSDKTCGPAAGAYTGTLETGCTAVLKAQDCGIVVWTICCPIEITVNYADDEYASVDVTNVVLGNENDTADILFNQFTSDHSYKTAAEGYVLQGYMEGGVWITEQGTVPGTVKLRWSGWKRGIFKKSGSPDTTIVPIENVGGGGEYTGGTFDSSVNDSIKYVPSTEHTKDFSNTLNNFKISMMNTGMGSMLNTFAGGIPSYAGSSAVTFTTVRLGTHTFDFAAYSSIWAWLGAIIMVVTSYVCIKIIILNGGK